MLAASSNMMCDFIMAEFPSNTLGTSSSEPTYISISYLLSEPLS